MLVQIIGWFVLVCIIINIINIFVNEWKEIECSNSYFTCCLLLIVAAICFK